VSRIISKFYKNFYEIFGRIGLEAKNNQLDFGVNYILAMYSGILSHNTDDVYNKCIGDDTKAAARQSLNCIKNNKK